MQAVCYALTAALSPLVGGLIAGLNAKRIGRAGAHWVTIIGVAIALLCSLDLAYQVWGQHLPAIDTTIYQWLNSGPFHFKVGFLIDPLSVAMMVTVTFVSLLVHIYAIGYMHEDPGYQRFFCYMSLFTFAMLMLVLANNFLQLFFGWEGVGVVSYLLIGFWFKKPSAAAGSMKAFLVNRVGDFGFLLGIAAVFLWVGGLDYADAFRQGSHLASQTVSLGIGHPVSVVELICMLLFVGAMGKSAQIPLHIWLPESMEGPTPISALIHAATMVTAGIYMVSRMSPLFEFADVARNLVMVIGATGALMLGLVGIVQHDIKRVVAYSTLSQLGYMIAATGASAYAAGMFHLITHACFKALLFLGAGSVIIGLHHEQDMRHMGGLRRYMPITHATFLIGTLALVALPPFSGFYSKDAIITAVNMAHLPGAGYAGWCLTIAAFVTSLYSFRALFLTFYGPERLKHSPVEESPRSVTIPLLLLAIPSVVLGRLIAWPMLNPDSGMWGQALFMSPQSLEQAHHLAHHYHSQWGLILGAFSHLPFWLVLAGAGCAYVGYLRYPELPAKLAKRSGWLYPLLVEKFGFDWVNDRCLMPGVRWLSSVLYRIGDTWIIDRGLVMGTGRSIARFAAWARQSQTGNLNHYALVMVLGLLGLLLSLSYYWI